MNPEIIFEDKFIIVFDKPSGMVVNRSNTYTGFTLQDVMDISVDDVSQDSDEDSEFNSRSGIIHRLDKDTSGVIIAAKDSDTFAFVQKQFKNREVGKVYYAVVNGVFKDDFVEIDAPIKRNPKFPLKYAVHEEGRPSFTSVEKQKTFTINVNPYSSVIAKPKTGRTHQIRVHLAALNNAIAGDVIYSTSKQLESTELCFNRLMLHALSISIIHPKNGTKMLLKSPLPEDFQPYF